MTKKVLPKEEWQRLYEHLENVAQLAEERAAKFGAAKLGRIVGLAHDLGKYSTAFQRRLEGAPGKVDHATGGAQEVYKCRKWGWIGQAMAFTIAGHHGGLPDGNKGDPKNLPDRLAKNDIPDYKAFEREVKLPDLSQRDLTSMPRAHGASMNAFSFSFCIRMLYSCLVDADYLDTERFMDIEKFQSRPSAVKLETLWRRLENMLEVINERGRRNPSVINNARHQILARCREMAETEPGLFTLTVPTGGGKTYSSLAFGLKHAVNFDKDRIIYVIPYTSIIEQNAAVFREALAGDAAEDIVLEHHSNFEYPEGLFNDWDKQEKAHRLATENWDMPVVVTTAVQFFESLYANKASRCRKLHNMVNSVIILDEAQLMPVEYLKPCLWALAELVLNYGATVVLCTATQPAVRGLLPAGVEPKEIMADPAELFRIFKRTTCKYAGKLSDEQVAELMARNRQVLTVVNTRRHARLLFDLLQKKVQDGIYHLSARMCPAHRKEVFAKIRKALQDGVPCHVVSTQLIEAGVDVDFPLVLRSAAGIDSIAQAAGRCNREGRLKTGQVVVFEPEAHGMPSSGRFEEVAGFTRSVIRRLDQFNGEMLSLGAIEDYFHQLLDFERDKLDAKGILSLINIGRDDMAFPFARIAEKFQLIDEETVPVVVPWDEQARRLMEKVAQHPFPASQARSLQPYVVQVYRHELLGLEKAGAVQLVGGFMNFIIDGEFYDSRFGIKDAKEVMAPTSVLIL